MSCRFEDCPPQPTKVHNYKNFWYKSFWWKNWTNAFSASYISPLAALFRIVCYCLATELEVCTCFLSGIHQKSSFSKKKEAHCWTKDSGHENKGSPDIGWFVLGIRHWGTDKTEQSLSVGGGGEERDRQTSIQHRLTPFVFFCFPLSVQGGGGDKVDRQFAWTGAFDCGFGGEG